jgi:hypothetical protein
MVAFHKDFRLSPTIAAQSMFRNKISTGGIWCQSDRNSPQKFTPPFRGSAITPWYNSTSPLDKECPNLSVIRTNCANDPVHILLHDSATLDFDRKFGGPQLSGNLLVE